MLGAACEPAGVDEAAPGFPVDAVAGNAVSVTVDVVGAAVGGVPSVDGLVVAPWVEPVVGRAVLPVAGWDVVVVTGRVPVVTGSSVALLPLGGELVPAVEPASACPDLPAEAPADEVAAVVAASTEPVVAPDDVPPETVPPDDVLPEAVPPETVLPDDVLPEAVPPEAVLPDLVSELALVLAAGVCPLRNANAAAIRSVPLGTAADELDVLSSPLWLLPEPDDVLLPLVVELELRLPAFVPVSFWPSAAAVRAVSKMLPKGAPLFSADCAPGGPLPGGAAVCGVLTGAGGASAGGVTLLASNIRCLRFHRECSARPLLAHGCEPPSLVPSASQVPDAPERRPSA